MSCVALLALRYSWSSLIVTSSAWLDSWCHVLPSRKNTSGTRKAAAPSTSIPSSSVESKNSSGARPVGTRPSRTTMTDSYKSTTWTKPMSLHWLTPPKLVTCAVGARTRVGLSVRNAANCPSESCCLHSEPGRTRPWTTLASVEAVLTWSLSPMTCRWLFVTWVRQTSASCAHLTSTAATTNEWSMGTGSAQDLSV